jgi:hypothetical protein
VKVVLAGSLREATGLALREGWPPPTSPICDWVYATEPRQLMGLTFDGADVFIIGTFWQRPNARELHDVVVSRMSRGPGDG